MNGADDIVRVLGPVAPPASRRIGLFAVFFASMLLVSTLVLTAVVAARARLRPEAPPYETAAVVRGDLRATVTARGTLQAVRTVEVGAEVSGRVLKVNVDANDRVIKGQVLAEIDREQLKGALDEAHAQLTVAIAAHQQALVTVEETRLAAARAKQLLLASLGTQRDLEAAVAAESRARAQSTSTAASVEVARAGVRQATWRLDRTRIVSPIDGVILARMIEPGQTVAAAFQAPVLFKLAENLDTLSLRVDIDEADVLGVREQAEASFSVAACPGRTFASRVAQVRNEPKITQSVVSYEAVLTVDNHDRSLRPGMTATASIVTGTRAGVLLVPNAALRFAPEGDAQKDGAPRVFVVNGAELRAVAVTRGLSDGKSTEVSGDGLEPGAAVVVGARETEKTDG